MNNLFGYPDAVVYMIQYSDEPIYKIGYTSDLNRRLCRIGLLLPYPVKVIHSIYTDSPQWLENHWHNHFASKRRPGSGIRRPSEWFNLTESDIREFKAHDVTNRPERHAPVHPTLLMQNEENSRESAVIRVIGYFNDLIRQHPQQAVKLANSCNYQISQVNAEVLRLQNSHGSEEHAIIQWEQRAYRAADRKVSKAG